MISIQGPQEPGSRQGFALFALGFRVFFLLAGLGAVLLMAAWLYIYLADTAASTYYDPVAWHSHEMVFGFTTAVIAGFLLTAVRNWTGIDTLQGAGLAALALLWLAGRLLPFLESMVPGWSVAVMDVAFLPALALVLAVPLLRGGQRHNLIFLPLLALMAFGNLLVHLEALGLAAGVGRQGLWLGLALVILLMVIVGGRVIPFFTERGLPGVRTHKWVPVEVTAIAGTLAWAMGVAMAPASPLTGAFAAVAAVAHALRLAGWHRPATWRVPLLWVLHLGYGWIVLGLAFQALAATGLMSPALALHALTAGAIGTLTLGMMARVALGHTGRALEPPLAVAGAFVLVNAAAAVRVLVPALMAVDYRYPVAISGMLWSAAFAIFVWVYVPIVVRPRVDGRPG